jgi:gliding motility-associated-like protein
MKLFLKITITLLLCLVFYTIPFAQCDLSNLFGDFDIPDNQDTCLSVTFSGIVNDDLSLNSIFTGIEIEFEHDAVSDLVIDITSPSGQILTIIGDLNGSGNLTTGAEWNVLFTECSGGTSPDSGISDTWDNDEPWVIGGSYTGIYYPAGGCFEDFNLGSANGTWTICIRDGFQFNTGHITRIGFVLNGVSSNNCNQCSAEAGDQSVSNIAVCTNEDLNLDLGLSGNFVDSDYSTIYLISQNTNLVGYNLDGNFVGLSQGTYEVCAVSILTDDLPNLVNSGLTYTEVISGITNNTLPYCADLTDNCTNVEINEAPPVEVLDAVICEGESIVIGGVSYTTAGSYSATRMKTGGDLCDTSVVLNLEVINIQPNILASFPEFSCINNTITLDASSSVQGSSSTFLWTSIDGEVLGDPSSTSIEITQAGTYVLSQSSSTCTLQTSITIGEANDIPTIVTSSPALTCAEDAVIISVNSSSTITAASWTGPSGFTSSTIEPTVTAAGRYEGAITDNTGCTTTVIHFVDQGADLPVVSATAPSLSCTSSSVPLSVSELNFPLYRWTGPQGFVSNIAEPNVTTPGIYYLEVQNDQGCKGYTTVEVLGDVGTFEYEISGNDFLCNGGTTEISATSEAGNAIYSWTGPNNFFSSQATNSVSAEGTYYLQIISNGCVVNDSITLERDISDLPEYDVQVENLGTCENPLWRLTAIPIANEFQASLVRWGIPGVQVLGSGNSIDVAAAGRYFLLINTFNGCAVVEYFTIDPLPESPSIALVSKRNANCTNGVNSGRIGVTENPNYQYDWTSSDLSSFTGDSSTIENLEPGFYDLTITDTLSGCVSFFTERIVADTVPRIVTTRNNNIDCNNPQADIILSANGGGNTYNWEGPDGNFNTPNISVSTPGDYIITVTGGNGCITLDTVNIIQDTNPPDFNLSGGGLECETQSILLDPNVTDQGVTFSWTGPNDFASTSAAPIVFATGQYDLTLTGLNGCVNTGSANVTANPDTPVPTASAPEALTCIDTLVQVFSGANVDIVSYTWDGPGSYISTEQNPFVSEPGQYIVTAKSTLGCIGFDTIDVSEIIILPEIDYTFDPTIDCVDISSQLEGISSDPQATFSWTGPNGYDAVGQIATALDTGTYYYFVRGSNNCVAIDTFQIGIEDISLTSAYTSNCADPGIFIEELSDSLTYNIIWMGANGFTSNEVNPIPTEQGIYDALVVGSNGCTASVSTTIDFDTLSPNAGINQLGTIRCEDNIILLDATGSNTGPEFEYSWMTSDGLILLGIDSFTSQIQGTGTYSLNVLNNINGCSTLVSAQVIEAEQDFVDIDFLTENPQCFGQNNGFITLNQGIGGTEPYTISLDGSFYTDEATLGNLAPGDYNIFVKDNFGCLVTESFTIQETEQLELDLGGTIDVFLGNETEVVANTNLSMDQIASIQWQIENQLGCSDCLSFTLTPAEDLLIELTIIDERGCEITDEVKVRVDQEPVLFKPNVFSPNEDGFNDRFYVYSNPGVASVRSMNIFDRWGNKVFTNSNFSPGDPTQGWDGSFKGVKALAGVYGYIIEVEMINGVSRMVRGNVTLVR